MGSIVRRRYALFIKLLLSSFMSMIAILLLIGCHRHYTPFPISDETFKLPHKVDGTSDTKVAVMMKAFKRGGVIKVTSIGSDYLIVMPSSALFPTQSPRLTWPAYSTLNQVVAFMKQFRKVAVNVTAYSGQYVSAKREQALTQARARAVGDYLWSQGIDSRFIFTEGAGSDKPISSYMQGGDASPSSRIEITFRDTIV